MGLFKTLKYMIKSQEPYHTDDDCGGDDE